jgi:hypothetical protein
LQLTASREIVGFLRVLPSALAAAECQTVRQQLWIASYIESKSAAD